jgi:hypothetical protein
MANFIQEHCQHCDKPVNLGYSRWLGMEVLAPRMMTAKQMDHETKPWMCLLDIFVDL